MKILHTADWHLGKRLDRFSRLDEQRDVLSEICEIAEAENVDAVLIAGDLYDTANPPHEAEDLFYQTLARLANGGKRAVVAIAGNHDAPGKIENPDPLARASGIILAGFPDSHIRPFTLGSGLAVTRSDAGFIELHLPETDVPLRLLLTPYANAVRFKALLAAEEAGQSMSDLLGARWQQIAGKYCDKNGVNLLMAHLFMMKRGGDRPEEPDDEKSILHIGGAEAVFSDIIPKQIQYAALGHLHRKQIIDQTPCPAIYSSSPLAYSMSEADQDKYVLIIEAEPGKAAKYREIRLKSGRRLLRETFDDVEKALHWLSENPDAIVELTMITENFLTAEESRRLHEAHDALLAVIPQVKNQQSDSPDNVVIDLSKNMEELFTDYFRAYHGGSEPNGELMALYREVIAAEKDKGIE